VQVFFLHSAGFCFFIPYYTPSQRKMSSAQTDRRFTEQREIPIRRIILTDPTQIPRDISATPNGTIYCTTPGGTRIVYDRSLLMKLSCSPLTKSPPHNLKPIPGVTSGLASIVEHESAPRVRPAASRKADGDEQLFEMEF